MSNPTWRRLVIALGVVASGIVALLTVLATWRSMPSRDPVLRAYARYCRKLARRGLAREASEAPLEFARRVALRWPDRAAQVGEITCLYALLRYGPTAEREAVRRLQRLVRHFRPGPGRDSPGAVGVPIMDTHGRG